MEKMCPDSESFLDSGLSREVHPPKAQSGKLSWAREGHLALLFSVLGFTLAEIILEVTDGCLGERSPRASVWAKP